jgi:hypothetical protein
LSDLHAAGGAAAVDREPWLTMAIVGVARIGRHQGSGPAIAPFELAKHPSTMISHSRESVPKWDAQFPGDFAGWPVPNGKLM